jgi:hypothetical protein
MKNSYFLELSYEETVLLDVVFESLHQKNILSSIDKNTFIKEIKGEDNSNIDEELYPVADSLIEKLKNKSDKEFILEKTEFIKHPYIRV